MAEAASDVTGVRRVDGRLWTLRDAGLVQLTSREIRRRVWRLNGVPTGE